MNTLNQWVIAPEGDPYKAPELRIILIMGVMDNENYTTNYTGLRLLDGITGAFSTWDGFKFYLGEPASDYEAEYPNARNRVIAQFMDAV